MFLSKEYLRRPFLFLEQNRQVIRLEIDLRFVQVIE